MGDLTEKDSSQSIKVVGSDSSGNETNYAEVNPGGNVLVIDTPEEGIDVILNLTTTAIEGKVGGSALVGRRYVEFEAISKNVKWGYNTSCNFTLPKKGFYALPCGENCSIYFKVSTGTGSIVFAEKK